MLNNQKTGMQDAKLKRRLIRASAKARLGGIGFILAGVAFFALGYLTNTPAQRQFDNRMLSRPTIADPVINNVAPLQAGRALSYPLMALMPFGLMGFGLLCVGMGIRSFAKGAPACERQDIMEERRIERIIEARQARDGISPGPAVENSLRFDGIYVLEDGMDFDWKYLIFFKSGRVRFPSSSLKPIRAFVAACRTDSSNSSTGSWSGPNYRLDGSNASFYVPPLQKVCGRKLTASIEANRLQLRIEYFIASRENVHPPKIVGYSFFPIPVE